MRKLIDGMTNICWPDINQQRNIPSRSSTGSIDTTQPAASICGNATPVDDDDVATADDNMFHLNLCNGVERWAAALNAKSMSRYEELCCGWVGFSEFGFRGMLPRTHIIFNLPKICSEREFFLSKD